MLKEIIQGYNDSKIAFIQELSDSNDIYDELSFLEDGYIKVKIDMLKKEYVDIQNQLELLDKYDKHDELNYNKQHELLSRIREIKLNIVFLASNNFNNIDSCESLIEELNTEFKLCIRGLKFYNEGNEKVAFQSFYEYFKNRDVILEHFLINKTYGTILFHLNQYETASKLLRKAAEKRPEDIELHEILKQIYIKTDKKDEFEIENTILDLLEEGI